MSFVTQAAGTQVRAITMPACKCGHAHGAHVEGRCAGWYPIGSEPCGCRAYRPHRPPDYRLSLSVARWKRTVCETLWAIERRAEAWRLHLEGSR